MYSQNLPNMVSFDSFHNEDHVNKKVCIYFFRSVINILQFIALMYIVRLQQRSNEHVNEQLMESVEDDVTLQPLFLNSYVQD